MRGKLLSPTKCSGTIRGKGVIARLSRCFPVSGRYRLRFRRAPLSKEDRENDDAANSHELARPILERLKPEG